MHVVARTVPNSRAPVPSAAMFERTALPSGPRVISARLPGARSVSIAAYVLAGSRLETAGPGRRRPFHGAHHVQGHDRASRRRGPSARRSRASAARSTPRPTANRPSTGSASRAARRARDGRPRRADRPADARRGEIDSERAVIVEEIRSYLDDPAEYCQILFQTAMFGDGPLGREICGDEAGIRALPEAADPRLLAATYRPANTVIALVGDLPHERRSTSRRPRSAPATASSRGSPRRRRCRPGPRDPAGGATRARPSCASGVPALRRDHPDAGRWRSSTRSSATGCAAASSCPFARSRVWPTTSRRAWSTTPTPARSRSPPESTRPACRRPLTRSSPSWPACATSSFQRRAREGQGVPVRRARAADGRHPPRRVLDRRPGGAP